MNTSSVFVLSLLALAAATGGHAQTSGPAPTGLLGQRYAEIGVGAIDPHGISDEGFAGDLSVNLPVQAGLDVGFSYAYNRLNAERLGGVFNQRSRDHAAYASVTAFQSYGGVKPFVGAALGYQWSRNRLTFGNVPVFDDREHEGLWGLGAGVEIPCGPVTLTPTVTYQDGFKRQSAAGFAYGTEASMWFTPKVGGFADVSYSDPTGGGTQAWTYRVGARFRF